MAAMRERGQLLLAGAFVLAVALIALTIVLNASMHTATLAQQENAISRGGDTVAARASITADLATVITHANQGQSDSFATRRSRFLSETQWFANSTRDHYGRHGRLVNVTVESVSNPVVRGTRIRQPTTGNLNDPAAPGDTVFPIADGVFLRNATFVLTEVRADSSTPFTLRMSDSSVGGSGSWEMRIYEQSGNVHIETKLEPTGRLRECVVPESYPIEIDVDEGTINGDYCPAFEEFGDSIGRYDVEFVNGNGVSGRYWLTVDQPATTVLVDSGAAADSEQEEVIYSTTLQFRYHSATVTYETKILIAPGELS